MSLYCAKRSVIVKIKPDYCFLGGHMDYPTDSTAKLCQGGKGLYVCREGVPIDNSSGENVNL